MIRERLFAITAIYTFEYVSQFVIPLFSFNEYYFDICGIFNAAMLWMFSRIEKTDLMKDIVKLLYIQMGLQCLGFIIYKVYPASYFYDRSIHAIVVATYIRIFLVGRYDLRNYTDGASWMSFRSAVGMGEKLTYRVSQ
jgi:hypothetical protein